MTKSNQSSAVSFGNEQVTVENVDYTESTQKEKDRRETSIFDLSVRGILKREKFMNKIINAGETVIEDDSSEKAESI